MIDRSGQQLGNYWVIRPIGRGGFADVYLGEHVYLVSSAYYNLGYVTNIFIRLAIPNVAATLIFVPLVLGVYSWIGGLLRRRQS